jgi:hypothetical protein
MNEIEKAIEELKSIKGICLYAEDGQQPTLTAICLSKVYDLAITALEAQKADMWIHVTVQKPDSNRVVQVYIQRKDGAKGRYVTNACYVAPKTQTTEDYGWENVDGEYDEENDCFWIPECWYEDNMIADNGNWVLNEEFDIMKWRESPQPWKEEQ